MLSSYFSRKITRDKQKNLNSELKKIAQEMKSPSKLEQISEAMKITKTTNPNIFPPFVDNILVDKAGFIGGVSPVSAPKNPAHLIEKFHRLSKVVGVGEVMGNVDPGILQEMEVVRKELYKIFNSSTPIYTNAPTGYAPPSNQEPTQNSNYNILPPNYWLGDWNGD